MEKRNKATLVRHFFLKKHFRHLGLEMIEKQVESCLYWKLLYLSFHPAGKGLPVVHLLCESYSLILLMSTSLDPFAPTGIKTCRSVCLKTVLLSSKKIK